MSICVSSSMLTRWAPTDGSLLVAGGYMQDTAEVTSEGGTVTADVVDGVASIDKADVLTLTKTLGCHTLEVDGMEYEIERVGSRYLNRADLEAYGTFNNDGFDDKTRYPDADIQAAIQAVEEAIEASTNRSFTKRMVSLNIPHSNLYELPVIDVTNITSQESVVILLSDRQCACSSAIPVESQVFYGTSMTSDLHRACVKLAASYIRPRATAENVKGSAQDGVYVSYTLATGSEGTWTGLPEVDAAIARSCSHRVVMS